MRILTAVDLTAYHWDLETDSLAWHGNAKAVLRLDDLSKMATGTEFNRLVISEHSDRRAAAMARARGRAGAIGRSYRVVYQFAPEGTPDGRCVWIEERGTWLAGPNERGGEAYGVLRVIATPEEVEMRPGGGHDEFTGHINRFRLEQVLDEVIDRTKRNSSTSGFLLVAIDNLGVINETFGFDVGDEAIRVIAQRLESRLRVRDTIGHYSSNKFGIILDGCDLDGMQATADRMRQIVRDTAIHTTSCQLPATVSIGGVLLPQDAGSSQHATAHALEALEKTKIGPRGRFVGFMPSARRESLRKRNITIADDVIAALDEDRMVIALQPIVNTITHEPVLYECLLRMRRTDGTVVPPNDFIPVAEQLGLSSMIDQRVLEMASSLARAHPNLHLSFNVSGLTPCDHHWLTALEAETRGDRALAERLTVEITETADIDDLDKSISFVDALQDLGCRVAIDDFGAGYTSFRNLKCLGVDMVKIDGSFITSLAANGSDRVFIEALVELAKSFGMETVAEWVDDRKIADILRAIGVTYLQGYYFGYPQIVSVPKANRPTALPGPAPRDNLRNVQ